MLSLLGDKLRAIFYRFRAALARSKTYTSKPNLTDLFGDPHVIAELLRAWYESNPHAPEVFSEQPGSRKREQGGWIVWQKRLQKLLVIRVEPGSRDRLPTIVGTRPPDTTEQEVVAWFHTHPNTQTEGYRLQAGIGDVAFTRAEAKVPGIIQTHEGRDTIPYP